MRMACINLIIYNQHSQDWSDGFRYLGITENTISTTYKEIARKLDLATPLESIK